MKDSSITTHDWSTLHCAVGLHLLGLHKEKLTKNKTKQNKTKQNKTNKQKTLWALFSFVSLPTSWQS